jgi:glycosyltransferase involved in cell wall biosynthesis
MTDPLGTSQVLPYLVGLSKNGFNITLISFEKQNSSSISLDQIKEHCSMNHIQWIPLEYHKNPPVLSTVMDLIILNKTIRNLLKTGSFDIIHCRSYLTPLAKPNGIPWIFDMRGFYADERVDGGLWNLKNPLYRLIYKFFKKKEREFLCSADYVISLTQAAADILKSTYENKIKALEVIPCCTDEVLFNPALYDRNKIRKQQGWENKMVYLYIGSLGTWYLIKEMIDFFSEAKKLNENSIFCIVTRDEAYHYLEYARNSGIPMNDICVYSASRFEVPKYIAAADAGIFFIRPAYSKIASSPVKQGEMMTMGLPVFALSGTGDSDKIITSYKAGILVYGTNQLAYQKALNEWNNSTFSPENIRNDATSYFSLHKGINQYKQIYLSIVSR